MKLAHFAAVALVAAAATTSPAAQPENWKDNAIAPVANPLFFESPLIQSEVRPIFAYHKLDDSFTGGFARLYALEVRYAVNDRLAIIATKDGFIQVRIPGYHADGWADIAAGLKYAVIDDKANAFIVTPGIKYELASGNTRVFQGNGSGEFNVFVSAEKGFGNFHVTGTFGGRIPLDFDEETASIHYSLMLDYYTCQWFIPFVGLNGNTVVSKGKAGATGGVEGFDLINFGSSDADGFTQLVFAVGLRSRICKWADLGLAWETSLTSPRGAFDQRYTVDMAVRF